MIERGEAVLVLRGWAEAKRRLRVIVRGRDVIFSAFCTVQSATDTSVLFECGPDNMVEFFFLDCICDFSDANPKSSGLPVGGKIESCIIFGRQDFELQIFLLPPL
jgi:hypothetical protein